MNKGRLAYILSIIAWAALCAICLTTSRAMPESEPEPAPASYQQVKPAPAEREPEEETGLDLKKLPSIVNATLTHYCICEECCGKAPDHPAYGITASGRKAEPYTSVAVDPFLIPLGSKVYIDYGDGIIHEYRADDTGSAVAGAHIDLCVEDHQEALELGVKTVAVWYAAPTE